MDGSAIDVIRCLDALPVPALLVRANAVTGCNAHARLLLRAGADMPDCRWLAALACRPAGIAAVVEHFDAAGVPLHLEVVLGTPLDGEGRQFALLREVDAGAAARQRLERGLEFERLLTRSSADLMRSPDDRLDAAIHGVLATLGHFFGIDRAYVFLIDAAAGTQSNTHEWTADDVSSERDHLQDIPLDGFPWLLAQLREDAVLRCDSIDDLPPEAAAERAECERQGIQSVLMVPLHNGGELRGYVGFDAVRRRVQWEESHVVGLRLLAQMLAGAIDSRVTAQQLRRQAMHDALTGLPNRLYLRHRFGDGVRGWHAQAAPVVAVVDVDDFKTINDRYGHAGGDAVLREIGRRLVDSIGREGVVARVGGDEFVVVEPAPEDGADAFAARLLAVAARPFDIADATHRVGISVGLVTGESGGDTLDVLLDRADSAMYRAKSAGKNRWALARARGVPAG